MDAEARRVILLVGLTVRHALPYHIPIPVHWAVTHDRAG